MRFSQLIADIAAGTLRAAPGVLVTLGPGDELGVYSSHSRSTTAVEGPVTVDALLHASLIVQHADEPSLPNGSVPDAHDWNSGWPAPSAEGTLLLTLEEALILPPGTTITESKLLILRFLAATTPQVGTALIGVVRDSSRLLSLAPTEGLAELLETIPDRTTRLSLFGTAKHGWQTHDPAATTGPLSPAVGITVVRKRHQYVATTPVLPSPGAIGSSLMTAAGIRPTATEARLVAAAEAYERHVAGVIHAPDLLAGTLDELEGAEDPDTFISFTAWQRDAHRELTVFRPDEKRVWAASRAPCGSRRYVLADLVFYPFGTPSSLRHTSATSSGVAAHMTRRDAELAAWAELVERDAFMRHWLARRPGRFVEFPKPPNEYAQMLADVRDAGWNTRLIQLGESPDLPVLCLVATKDGGVVLGAAAGVPERAAVSALRETWAALKATNPHEAVPQPDAVRTPTDHRRLYQRGNVATEVAFLDGADEVVSIRDLRPLDRLPASCITYAWPWHVSRPFHVVRVLDPQMIPITFGFEREPLGRDDVGDILASRGESGRGMMPHPFG